MNQPIDCEYKRVKSNNERIIIPYKRASSSGQDINIQTELQKAFKFLIRLVLYCPLWVRRTERNKHNKTCICNAIGMLITVSSLVFSTLFLCFRTYQHLLDYNSNEFFHIFYYEATWIFWVMARCIAVYYFWRIFKYPDIFKQDSSNNEMAISIETQNKILTLIRRTRYRMIIFILLLMIGQSIELFQYFRNCLPISKHLIYLIYWFCFKMMQIPMLLSQCVVAVIFLNYRLELEKLRDNLKNLHYEQLESDTFQNMLNEYQKLWRNFNEEYTLSLQWFYTFFVAAELCNCWVGMDNLLQVGSIDNDECNIYKDDTSSWVNITTIIVSVIILTEFVLSSSGITNTFQRFQQELLDCKWNNSDLQWLGNSYFDYLYFSQRIDKKYKLRVNVVGLPVSTENVIRFIIAFIVAKTISYSIYSYG